MYIVFHGTKSNFTSVPALTPVLADVAFKDAWSMETLNPGAQVKYWSCEYGLESFCIRVRQG